MQSCLYTRARTTHPYCTLSKQLVLFYGCVLGGTGGGVDDGAILDEGVEDVAEDNDASGSEQGARPDGMREGGGEGNAARPRATPPSRSGSPPSASTRPSACCANSPTTTSAPSPANSASSAPTSTALSRRRQASRPRSISATSRKIPEPINDSGISAFRVLLEKHVKFTRHLVARA